MSDDIDDMSEDDEEQLKEFMQGGSGGDSYGYPKPPKREDVFTFFRHILGLKDSRKVANYKDEELGRPRRPVRAYMDVAVLAYSLHYPTVAMYLLDKAEIISATSLGRRGFLSTLFVTQIKRELKFKSPEQKKGGWFSKPKENSEGIT